MAETMFGKEAERKIKAWLDRPEDGYSIDRIPDQLTGFIGSSNIADFICFKSPEVYYIESKATQSDRFDFSMITDVQYNGLLRKSKIAHVHGYVIVLFVEHKRAFIVPIQEIDRLQKEMDQHSLNINKVNKWGIKFQEIETIPNNRKRYLDYTGELTPVEESENKTTGKSASTKEAEE